MKNKTNSFAAMLTVGLVLSAPAISHAAEIFNSGEPGGFFGYTGDDLYTGQSVAVAFTPPTNMTFDSAALWIMSNDFDAAGRTYSVSLETDGFSNGQENPSGVKLESWDVSTAAVGWNPVLEENVSTLHPLLTGGQQYWIVARSTEEGGTDPVWVWGGDFTGLVALDNEGSLPAGWISGVSTGSVPGLVINATAVPEPTLIAAVSLLALPAFGRRRR